MGMETPVSSVANWVTGLRIAQTPLLHRSSRQGLISHQNLATVALLGVRGRVEVASSVDSQIIGLRIVPARTSLQLANGRTVISTPGATGEGHLVGKEAEGLAVTATSVENRVTGLPIVPSSLRPKKRPQAGSPVTKGAAQAQGLVGDKTPFRKVSSAEDTPPSFDELTRINSGLLIKVTEGEVSNSARG